MDTIQVNPISELEEMLGQDARCETWHGYSTDVCSGCRHGCDCVQKAEYVAVVPCCGARRLKCDECLHSAGVWDCPVCGEIKVPGFSGAYRI